MSLRRFSCLLGILLLAPALSEAGDFVCGYDTVSTDRPSLHRFTQSSDPTRVPPCPAPYVPSEVPEAQIQAQRTLYDSLSNKKHIKVISGLMVEMTDPEKAVVDAPAQAQAAAEAVAKQEVTSNEICANHTLPEITAYWKGPGSKQAQLQATIATLDTAIAAVGTGPAKTAIVAAREALVAHMTMFIDGSELIWRYMCSRTFIAPVP